MLKLYSKEFWKLFFIAAVLMLGLAYYQSTLVLYLTNHFHYQANAAYEINGVFLAAVYLCPIITGWISKKWLQPRPSIILGLFMYGIGTLLSAISSINTYILALTIISLGYGLLYINTFFLIGSLYQLDNSHREGGFTLAYMALNIGAIIGFTMGGHMLSTHNFQVIIFSLGIFFTLVASISIFILKNKQNKTEPKNNWLAMFCALVIVSITILTALKIAALIQTLLSIICFALLFIIFYIGLKEYQRDHTTGKKIILLGVLTLFSVIFWTFYKMQDSFILVFIQQHGMLNLHTYTIPASTLLSINPIIILLAAPLISIFWLKTGTKYSDPVVKISLGLGFMGLGFGALYLGVLFNFPIHLIWIVLFFALIAMAEVILGPGIISMVGQLSNEKYHLILLGLTNLSLSAAGIFSAQIATFFQNRITQAPSLAIGYLISYRDIALLLIIVSLLIFAYKRFIAK